MDFRGFNVRSHQFKETPGNSTQRLRHSLSSSSDMIEELLKPLITLPCSWQNSQGNAIGIRTVILSNRTTFFVHFTGLIISRLTALKTSHRTLSRPHTKMTLSFKTTSHTHRHHFLSSSRASSPASKTRLFH